MALQVLGEQDSVVILGDPVHFIVSFWQCLKAHPSMMPAMNGLNTCKSSVVSLCKALPVFVGGVGQVQAFASGKQLSHMNL